MSEYVKYGVFAESKTEKETSLADTLIERIKKLETDLEVEFVQIEWSNDHQSYMIRVKQLTDKYAGTKHPLNSTKLEGTVTKEEKEALELLAGL
jgi:hypothetical protein